MRRLGVGDKLECQEVDMGWNFRVDAMDVGKFLATCSARDIL